MKNSTIILLLTSGCIGQFSGASEPTAMSHGMSPEMAAKAFDEACLHPVTGNPDLDYANDLDFFRRRGIDLIQLDSAAWPFTTSFKNFILLESDFQSKTTDERVLITSHERVHTCQREEYLGRRYERLYAFSDFRLAVELQAYRQDVVILSKQGKTQKQICHFIDGVEQGLADLYWLHDIDQQQRSELINEVLTSDIDYDC